MLYKKSVVWLWVIFFAISLQSFAGTIRHDTEDSKYIKHANKYESVVRFHGNVKNSKEKNLEVSASAILIKPRWIITAAHIITCSENHYILVNDDKKYDLDFVIIHKDFNENVPVSMGDLALGKLKEDVKEDIKFPLLYSDDKEEKRTCSISGYGMYGTGITGAKIFDSKKRAGTNKIIFVNEHILVCNMSLEKQEQTILEFLPSHGDSGGGLFIDGKLAGINSFVSSIDKKPDSTYGDESAHTRISAFKPWIIETIKQHENE